MRKLTVILLSAAIALVALTTVSLAENPQAYWNTPQEYEKATGNKIEKFNEAPMLRAMVAAGEIPPVEKRLPEEPQVIVPVEEVGQYGGTWRLPYSDPYMGELRMIMYDPPVRYRRDSMGYIPGLAREWEFSNDGRTITFHFRKGVKWSDGYPFTTEDLRFWWEDLATNKDYGVVAPAWWAYNEDKTLAEVKFIGDYTMSLTFKEAHYLLPEILACGFWEWESLMRPKHYLEQFHPKYNSEMKDYSILQDKSDWHHNPDHPTLYAWITVEYRPGKGVTLERNPYYWKVDTAGNQLPYIDRLEGVYVKDSEVRLLQIIRGEYDATFRGIANMVSIPLLEEKKEAGGYRVLHWRGLESDPWIMVNHTYNWKGAGEKDDFKYKLLRNKFFTRALSYAIDRKRINDIIYAGMGKAGNYFVLGKDSWYFQSAEGKELWQEYVTSYAEYNPKKANELLDEIGLTKRDNEGFRTRPDGSKLEIILNVETGPTKVHMSELPLVLKNYWEAIGLRIILNIVGGTPESWPQFLNSLYQLVVNASQGAASWNVLTYPSEVFASGTSIRFWPGTRNWLNDAAGYQEEPKPGSPEYRLIKLYRKATATTDNEERNRIVLEAVRIHLEEGPFYISAGGDTIHPVVIKNNFRNVPSFGVIQSWEVGGPGNTNPEQYFIKE